MKIFTGSHSSEDLRWISSENLVKAFKRKDFMKILIKTFSSKDLQTISSKNLFETFERSSVQIVLKSLEDLLVFVLIFNFEKNLKNAVD